MATIELGEAYRFKVIFTDPITNRRVDPSSVVLTVETPSSTETTPSMTNDSTGSYYYDGVGAVVGTYQLEVVGTMTVGVAKFRDAVTVIDTSEV